MVIRRNKIYRPRFRHTRRGFLYITKHWLFATGSFERIYGH